MPDEKTVIDDKQTIVADPFDATEFYVKKDEPIIDDKNKPVITEDKNKPIVIEDKNKSTVVDDKNKPVIIDDKNKPEDDEIEDEDAYVKKHLNFDNIEAAKEALKELEDLRVKAKTAAEIKYENLDAKKIKEIHSVIDKKERLDLLTTGEITKENAPDIIKAAMAEKYKLKPEQVNYKFNKQFGIPKSPVQDTANDESDEDFAARKNEHKEKVADIEMEMLIEASVVRPDLEKINSEIKLPEINTNSAKKEPTPEELAKVQEGRNMFLQDAGVELKKFEGFTATYKDKDVEIQSSYKLSDDENKVVMSKIQKFAENGFDANAIFGERWVKGDKFDFIQMAKDLAAIETDEKRSQKYLSDAKEKSKLAFIKGKHQIELNTDTGKGELKLEDKTAQQKSEDAVWGITN